MTRRIVAALALALLAGCNPSVQNNATPTPSPNPTSSALSLKISGHGTAKQPVRIVEQTAKSDRVQYDLLATSYVTIGSEGNTRADFKHVHITFHGKDGSMLIADAPQAILDQVSNTIELVGGVHAHNNAGSTLACDTLRYDHRTEMIYGSGHVAITGPGGFHATGNRFESNISLTHTVMQ
ncbi:MAG TPA: LPS export ABC transporter periplasmic protein LptC [Candidatus Baltobacteraceae bacterium]|nr:LPS export ABC transporter periplasmic protein LptC [Candidatus Baltobacteraceae bacterium]